MSEADKKPYLYDEKESDCALSLSKFVGKEISDIVGYVTDPFGGTPLFNISCIVFEDGTKVHIKGAPHVAYIPANDKLKNMDKDTLQSFIEEE